ncbi:hypothetical protein C2869_21745 (plasmid) [Saccharobesus litoralis]|uniref:Porin n=2 Tax=Saccharobesus litoralis TaxID=2172099 RepID=A0A2S0VYC1_9ALTE|nr:hypothetical protein C2869_21745 [Saccharobesus litoralis]
MALAGYTTDNLRLYGYFSWRVEKVWDELAKDSNNNTVTEDAPREIAIPSFNIMALDKIDDNAKVFFNLSGADGEGVEVNNIWGEYKFSQYVNLRVGKSYRRFGLYNEILDAVPTYIGIEPPELFDKDHLILSRTTLLMLHGWTELGDNELRYSFSIDNGEGGPTAEDNIPIGFDLRYSFNFGSSTIGISGYSSNGDTTSDVGVGQGSPRSGVLPWMAADDFSVFGGYGEFLIDDWTLQFAYWTASHNAVRDPNAVVEVVNNAGINDAQRARFLIDPNGAVNTANVNLNGDYDVTTWYVRAGYSFSTDNGEWVPYGQWDFYENPETIESKKWGGDAEAGLADDGKFSKSTLGVIYRPTPAVAFKFDTSTHFQKFNGKDESYSEIRLDISYIFGQ